MHPTPPTRLARRLSRASIYDAPLALPPIKLERRVLLPIAESERRVLVRRFSSKTLQLKAG